MQATLFAMENPFHGEQVKVHLEVTAQVLLLCRCSHLSLNPLFIIYIQIKNGQGIANLARKFSFGKRRSIGKFNPNLIVSSLTKGAIFFFQC